MFPIFKRIGARKAIKIVENITRYRKVSNLSHNLQTTPLCAIISTNNLQNIRCKTKKMSKIPQKEVTESASEGYSDDESFDSIKDKHSKVMKISVPNLRVDAVLKTALGISRNKIDLMFYENRIRVNGEKILKKNENVNEEDEVDVIKSVNPANPDHLIVARVEILSIRAEDDKVNIKIRRYKSLAVENYPGSNSWKD